MQFLVFSHAILWTIVKFLSPQNARSLNLFLSFQRPYFTILRRDHKSIQLYDSRFSLFIFNLIFFTLLAKRFIQTIFYIIACANHDDTSKNGKHQNVEVPTLSSGRLCHRQKQKYCCSYFNISWKISIYEFIKLTI